MPRSVYEPNVRLGSPTIVSVTSGQCSDAISLVAGTVDGGNTAVTL